MRLLGVLATVLLSLSFPAAAQEKVVLGMSGWTGFQPLKLAELAGLFKKNGVDIEIRFIAPVQRSAALASGALNAAATTVDQHIVWASAGIPSVQVALSDKSKGGAGPRGTPTLSDDGRVYAFGGTGILNALDEASGKARHHDVA